MLTIIPIRKTFLKQASFALVGSCIPFAKLFAEGLKPPHGIMKVPPDNFDVAGSSEDNVDTYIAVRAAVFFQTIMNVPTTAAYPPYNYRGKSLFRSTDTDTRINETNQRRCEDCDGNPSSDTCNVTNEDPACDIQ